MCVRVLRCKSKRSAGEKWTVLEKFDQSLRQIKAAAAEIVVLGLTRRVKAALALPLGPERLTCLQAAKDAHRKR